MIAPVPEWLVAALAGLSLGLLLGWLIGALVAARQLRRIERDAAVLESRLKSQQQLDSERDEALGHASERLAAHVSELADRVLGSRSEAFLQLARENLGQHQVRADAELREHRQAIQHLVSPITAALAKTEAQLAQIEKERREAYGSLTQALEGVATVQDALRAETRALVTALRRPEVRGQWGELTLRRLVELAGMVEHCDFVEQPHQVTDDGAIRPDMIVRMPEKREVVVDAKTPLDAYLEAIEAPDEASRRAALRRHAGNLGTHIKTLAARRYWEQFERTPEFVILFIPGDQFLAAALDAQPDLFERALRLRVMLATPTSFISLLKAIAYGWDQHSLAENAALIRDLAVTLHKRLVTFSAHLATLGRHLASGVAAFNRAVGSLERSVLPSARRFTELGVQGEDLEALEPLDAAAREVQLPHEAPPDTPGPRPGADTE